MTKPFDHLELLARLRALVRRGNEHSVPSSRQLVVGSADGQSSSVDLGGGSDLVFAANPGSDDISVFQVQDDGSLTLMETQPSGGERPISLTVNRGMLYVLNSAGDGFPGSGFCYGGMPTISGFRVAEDEQLDPIPDSIKLLSGGTGSGCTQITFDPAGDVLLVTQLGTDTINTFTVGNDGVAQGPVVNQTSGTSPFGVTFDREGRLLTTENSGARKEESTVASYSVGSDGRLAPISNSLPSRTRDLNADHHSRRLEIHQSNHPRAGSKPSTKRFQYGPRCIKMSTGGRCGKCTYVLMVKSLTNLFPPRTHAPTLSNVSVNDANEPEQHGAYAGSIVY